MMMVTVMMFVMVTKRVCPLYCTIIVTGVSVQSVVHVDCLDLGDDDIVANTSHDSAGNGMLLYQWMY